MILSIILLLIATILLVTIIKGAPPVPTSKSSVEEIVNLANIGKGDRIIDLGSGDGRVIIAFAKKGIKTEGYEINPFLVLLTKYKIKKAGVSELAKVHWRDFWGVDLGEFDIINVYGVTRIMEKLNEKLKKELTPGTRVLSNMFQIPGWKEDRKVGRIYLYIKK